MFDNLPDGNVVDLSDDDLDIAMGPAKRTTKKPTQKTSTDDEHAGTDSTKKTSKKPTSKASTPDKPTSEKKAPIVALPGDALEDAFGNTGKKKKTEKVEDPEEDEDPEDENEEQDEPLEDPEEDEDPENDDEPNNEEDEPEDDDEPTDEEAQIKDFLKARVDLLVKKGQWVDFKDRDTIDWTEENFAQMEIQQREYAKELMRKEILDNFGPVGYQIAEYTENGGDPNTLIEIFKEQQTVQALSLDTENGKKEAVFKYETEFLGKKPERVRKYIENLIADKELDSEAQDAKDKMEAHWDNEAKEAQELQKEAAQERDRKQKEGLATFSTNITKTINDDKDIADDEKKKLLKVLTKFDKKLGNGQPVNEFYQIFAEFRKDSKNYLDLVRFVMDKDKFMKTLKTQGKNERTEKAFSLARSAKKAKKTTTNLDFGDDTRGKKPRKSGFVLY